MTTAVYRGHAYNIEERKLNVLALIKRQLEAEQRRHRAQIVQIKGK